ncbi:MAG TPA: zf-HC2 domain-containing protein [Thermomicrobiales bacterium]|nr:zf-HC2 domain-containing protein [Thermomicrobiales bacterium]
MAPTSAECAHVEELLSAVQDGAASPADQELVRRHLATCDACRATAAAFERNDERLRDYLRATPVPPIGAPWREARPRRARGAGTWRVALVSLATVLVLVVGATWLVQRQAGVGQQRELSQSAGRSAQIPAAAPQATHAQGPAADQATAPAPAAAFGAAPRPTPAAAAAQAAGGAAATAAPTPVANAAAGAAPHPAAAASPAAAAPARATFNPVQRYGLANATALTLCWPACEARTRPPALLAAVVQALDRDVAVEHPAPPAGPTPTDEVLPPGSVTLVFALPDGGQVRLVYDRQGNRLRLPDGAWAQAPPELAAALAGVAPQP